MKLIGTKSFPDTEAGYYDAERFADQWAGDNNGYAVVAVGVDDDRGIFVMDQIEARGFCVEWNAVVLYHADHRGWCHTCENIITGQRIRSNDRDYCSFVCLDDYTKRTR